MNTFIQNEEDKKMCALSLKDKAEKLSGPHANAEFDYALRIVVRVCVSARCCR